MNGTCTENVTDTWCYARGGGWQSGGTCADCGPPPVGVCCDVDGECLDGVTINGCPSSAWIPFLTCADPNIDAYCEAEMESDIETGACCLSGRCEELSSSQCALMGGLLSEGITCEDAGCRGFGTLDPDDEEDKTVDWCAASPLVSTPCGSCGVYACLEDGTLSCDEALNACGGCSALDERAGSDCGACGVWLCAGRDSLECFEPEEGCPEPEDAGIDDAGVDDDAGSDSLPPSELDARVEREVDMEMEPMAQDRGVESPDSSNEDIDNMRSRRGRDDGCAATGYTSRSGMWLLLLIAIGYWREIRRGSSKRQL